MVKGNPNHDPNNGQFTSGSSGNQKMNDVIRSKAGITQSDIEHAKGVLAARDIAGVQVVGASNIKRAEAVMQKQGLKPIEKRVANASTFKFADEYKNRNPVVGDKYIFPKGTTAEISSIRQTPLGTYAIDYIEIGSKGGRTRTFYLDKLV